jgi:two-component system sensor kinase FixL
VPKALTYRSSIEVGSAADFADSFYIREMKDYRKMSRKQLLACIEQLGVSHLRRSRTQKRKAEAELYDREARLRAILDTAVEGIITIDERGIIESANPAAQTLFGYRQTELAGKNISLLMPHPHRTAHDGYLSNYQRTGHAKIIGIGREEAGRRKDGSTFPMDLSVSEVKLKGRRLFTGFIRDISARKESEKALRYYEALVASSDDAIIGKTLKGRVTSWNHGAEIIFGYSPKEMIGRPVSKLIPKGRKDEEPVILKKICKGESVDHFETLRRRKDGRLIDVSVTISPIRDAEGKIIGASKVARNITERKRLQKEILEISEREQRRIGQDLHDGLCQHLAGIEMLAQVLAKKLNPKLKAGSARATEIAKSVREAIGHTRLLARGLSPVTLESEGLMSALTELALNTEKIFGIQCVFDCKEVVKFDDHAASTHLFRIAQEAVSNAIKHGKAQKIVITLRDQPENVFLSVRDQGQGFLKKSGERGMGLRIMRTRIGMVGGSLAIGDNSDGRGATVACLVPKQK